MPSTDLALANCSIRRPALLPGVEVVAAQPGLRSFPPHVSDSLGICVKTGSAHGVTVEGRERRYPADAICVRAPGCVWASEAGVHGFVSIDVARKLLPGDCQGTSMVFLTRGALPDPAVLARRMVIARDELEAQEALARLVGAVFATGVAESEEAREPGAAGAVADACEFLRAQSGGRPTLEEVATAAGVSKYALLRRFRTALGTTPHAYLIMVRVSHAQMLLADGAGLAESAAEAGFADQAHLGLWFRRLLGITPGAYRRQVRSAISL